MKSAKIRGIVRTQGKALNYGFELIDAQLWLYRS